MEQNKCRTCIHRSVCRYNAAINNFMHDKDLVGVLELAVKDCMYHASAVEITKGNLVDAPLQIDKNEEVIKDFSKRSEMIKNSYKDAKGKDLTCPSCKSKVSSLSKCMDCGSAVCENCGILVSVNAREGGLLCNDCWTKEMIKDDQEQELAIKVDTVDLGFLKDVVRQDIPEN